MAEKRRTETAATQLSQGAKVAREQRWWSSTCAQHGNAEIEQFVEWFCVYWRERGAHLFAERLSPKEGENGKH
jgi:hypothetical protein